MCLVVHYSVLRKPSVGLDEARMKELIAPVVYVGISELNWLMTRWPCAHV
jgi:hypothetical protein